ncbi:MAG: HD domain-containing protein [Candidatus Margulisiibacteriota bacterium]
MPRITSTDTPRSIQKILRGQKFEGYKLISGAYHFAEERLAGLFRKDGRPSIAHAIGTTFDAFNLMRINEPQTLAACLLHDLLEDTPTTNDELAERFGKEVANLVEGETKLSAEIKDRELQNERAWHLALANDPRIGLIKAADRHNNMGDQRVFTAEKRREHALETRDLYAMVADRLGVWEMKIRLGNLAWQHLSSSFAQISRMYRLALKESKPRVDRLVQALQAELCRYKIGATITHKTLAISEVFHKMQITGRSFADMLAENPSFLDYIAVILKGDDLPTISLALGIARKTLNPLNRTITDFHAFPREETGYRAFHTQVIVPGHGYVLVGATTETRDLQNRYGIISEGMMSDFAPGWHLKRTEWLERWRIYLLNTRIATERDLRADFARITSRITVTTQAGQRIEVPVGSTVLDFAFFHGAESALHVKTAMVNGRQVDLGYVLQPYDQVVLLGQQDICVNPTWLALSRSAEAEVGIRGYLSKLQPEKRLTLALESIGEALAHNRLTWDELKQADEFDDFLSYLNLKYQIEIKTADDLLLAVGGGELGPHEFVQTLIDYHNKLVESRKTETDAGKFQIILIKHQIIVEDKAGEMKKITERLSDLGLNIRELHAVNILGTGRSEVSIIIEAYSGIHIIQIKKIMQEAMIAVAGAEQLPMVFSSPSDDEAGNP